MLVPPRQNSGRRIHETGDASMNGTTLGVVPLHVKNVDCNVAAANGWVDNTQDVVSQAGACLPRGVWPHNGSSPPPRRPSDRATAF